MNRFLDPPGETVGLCDRFTRRALKVNHEDEYKKSRTGQDLNWHKTGTHGSTLASVTSSQPIVYETEPEQDFNDDEFSKQHLPS